MFPASGPEDVGAANGRAGGGAKGEETLFMVAADTLHASRLVSLASARAGPPRLTVALNKWPLGSGSESGRPHVGSGCEREKHTIFRQVKGHVDFTYSEVALQYNLDIVCIQSLKVNSCKGNFQILQSFYV